MDSTAFLAFLDFENEPVFFSDRGSNIRFDRVIDGSKDIHLHQITDQLKWLDADTLSQLSDDDGRFDMNRFIVGYGGSFIDRGGRRGLNRLRHGRRHGFRLDDRS
jgi:hypothetical protein